MTPEKMQILSPSTLLSEYKLCLALLFSTKCSIGTSDPECLIESQWTTHPDAERAGPITVELQNNRLV